MSNKMVHDLKIPKDLNVHTSYLVVNFAEALAEKLTKAQEKYNYTDGWRDPEIIVDLALDLENHIQKGDPLDVAAYCAFLWYHKASVNGELVVDKG